MWIKIGNEYLNLDHVVRVRWIKTWKNGQDEVVAEVEGYVKNEVQVFIRYRGQEAETLLNYLRLRAESGPLPEIVEVSHSSTTTLPEVNISGS